LTYLSPLQSSLVGTGGSLPVAPVAPVPPVGFGIGTGTIEKQFVSIFPD
jgi:hypothetical protein